MKRSVTFWLIAFVMAWRVLVAGPAPVESLALALLPISIAIQNIIPISMFIEAILKRISSIMVIFPIILYGIYYMLYFEQSLSIWKIEQALRDASPHVAIRYDPELHSLVVLDPGQFVTTYRAPVVFSPSPQAPEQTNEAFRLMLDSTCQSIPVHDHESWTQPVQVDGKTLPGICILRRKEDTDKVLLTVSSTQERAEVRTTITKYTIMADGKPIAEYRGATTQRYSPVPLFTMECTTSRCRRRFYTYQIELDTIPGIERGQSPQHLAAALLGIEPYQGDERFEMAARNHADEINRVQAERLEKGIQSGLALLDHILSNPQADWEVWNSLFWVWPFLQQAPGRLTGNAERLATLYLDLMTIDTGKRDTDVENKALHLSRVLALLEPDVFREHGPRIAQAALQFSRLHPTLYLKVAGLGDAWFETYQAHFTELRESGNVPLLPTLALCRIGKASAQTIETAKQDFLWEPKRVPRYHQALFLFLLRVGEREFVVENYAAGKPQESAWYERILAGEAETEFGPNRCMTSTWIDGSPLPPEMRPVL